MSHRAQEGCLVVVIGGSDVLRSGPGALVGPLSCVHHVLRWVLGERPKGFRTDGRSTWLSVELPSLEPSHGQLIV